MFSKYEMVIIIAELTGCPLRKQNTRKHKNMNV